MESNRWEEQRRTVKAHALANVLLAAGLQAEDLTVNTQWEQVAALATAAARQVDPGCLAFGPPSPATRQQVAAITAALRTRRAS